MTGKNILLPYVDSHAHLLNEFYNDLDFVISEAYSNNVKIIINCSDSMQNIEEVISLSTNNKNIYSAIGIHPENALSDLNDINKLEEYIKNNNIIALGEIGLDYYHGKDYKEEQKLLLKKQLDLAQKYNLPVIIHSRDAINDTYEILKGYNLKGVIHCFSSSEEMAKKFIQLGYFIGIGGTITFKNNKKTNELLKSIGIENIILETDCPFLSPEPVRGTKNTPKNIPFIAKHISNLLNIAEEEVRKVTTNNVIRLFDLKI